MECPASGYTLFDSWPLLHWVTHQSTMPCYYVDAGTYMHHIFHSIVHFNALAHCIKVLVWTHDHFSIIALSWVPSQHDHMSCAYWLRYSIRCKHHHAITHVFVVAHTMLCSSMLVAFIILGAWCCCQCVCAFLFVRFFALLFGEFVFSSECFLCRGPQTTGPGLLAGAGMSVESCLFLS